ncbi:endothelin-converting enzyme homolog [Musca autumnalis]|uniref:endothelin-converting enzyme homolog n=1 Tax=Musca autumnalis TaxID=221902 RepID=UPI003CF95FA6
MNSFSISSSLYLTLVSLLLIKQHVLCELIRLPHAPALTSRKIIVNHRHLKSIEGSMDLTTDPCENFYQYACGNWDSMHTNITKYHDYYRMIEYYTNREMAIALQKKTSKTKEPKFMENVRAYFKSCTKMKHLDLSQFLKWLQDHENLRPVGGGGYRKDNATADAPDWLRTLAVLTKYGLSDVLLEETYFKDLHIIKISRPQKNNGFVKFPYQTFKVLTYSTFGWKNETLDNKWILFSSLEQELYELQKLQMLTNGTHKYFNLFTIQDIPWLKYYINLLLNNTQFPVRKLKIFISDISYITRLYKLLQAYDDEFICEYLQIRFLWSVLINGYTKFSPEMCALKTRQFMYLATDWLFERQHQVLVKNIPKIEQMFKNIKEHYRKVLLTNPNGFDTKIMSFLMEKLNGIQLQVGHLPRSNTQQKLEDIYSHLDLDENNFYHNQMQLLKFYTNNTLLNYIATQNRTDYIEHDKKLSPYFHRIYNTVVLPITTLQLPIYDVNLNDLYQYSSIGYILGHEITHGFDTQGTQRDANGRKLTLYHDMINANPRFEENLECIRNLNNGRIDEKIADITGFRVAFQTFFELHPKARQQTLNVNGRNMTLDKIFFLNHAQFRCTSTEKNLFADKTHGTAEDRIVDALSHFPEFVKTFQCSKYSDMFLEKTCQLWRR